MPWEKKGAADHTLVFDTFVAVGRSDPLVVGRPDAILEPPDRAALGHLVAHLATLGRAEGWVHAELADVARPPADWNARPRSHDSPGADGRPVLCPDPASSLGHDHYPAHDPRKLLLGLRPDDRLFDCPRWHLCLDTQTVHAERWPALPGARWVPYSVRDQESGVRSLRLGVRAHGSEDGLIPQPPSRRGPTVARLLLDGPVLPLVTDTVRVAGAVRAAAMSQFQAWARRHPDRAAAFRRPDRPDAFASPVLSGKDRAGVMRADHGHAYYLPTAEGDGDDRRRITHVTVRAADGFGPGEVAALTGLRRLRLAADELRVQLVGLGRPADFTHPLFRTGRVWRSMTPFVGPSHTGRHAPERYLRKAVRKEVRRRVERGLLPAEPTAIELLPAGQCPVPALRYRRHRNREGDRKEDRPAAFLRLTFAEPVAGPIALGYASHFGLGLFVPGDAAGDRRPD
jgi:CRISPR-associated protein Csb2